MIVRKIREWVRVNQLACVVLVFSLGLTWLAWYTAEVAGRTNIRQRFDFQSREISSALSRRLREYETILRSGAGVFNASDTVDRLEWHNFIDDMRLPEHFPGIRGLGFSPVVPAAGLAEHEAAVRREGFADYAVFPPGEREMYVPVLYVEPFDRWNRRALGFDMYSEPVRQAAMALARDSGQPAISGRVTLVRSEAREHDTAFQMYLPVYTPNKPLTTVEERRAAIRGFVFSPFLARDFVAGALVGDLEHLHIELYDNLETTAESLLYANGPQERTQAADFSAEVRIQGTQREWLLRLHALPGYWSPAEKIQPMLIAIFGVVIDLFLFFVIVSVGRRKQDLEAMSQRLRAQLRESEQYLSSAIEAIGEAFVIYDPDDRLAFCNEEYRNIYRKSAPVIEIGRSFEEILRYGAERGQYRDAIGRIEEWVAERLEVHRRSNVEFVQCLEDGRWLKIREHKTPDGHIVGFRVDVTEFYRAKEAAEAANQAKSQFLATMSHEIRTPMNGILGMAQILLEPQLSEAERQSHVRAILRSGQNLLTLLNGILDLSKVEAGKLELERTPFAPVEIVRETVELFAAPAKLKQLALSWSSPLGPEAHFLGDAARLRQMLSNLVGNAVKFTPQGRVEVGVALLEGEAGPVLEFAVSDTGIGIDPHDIEQLFQPFSQADGSATRQHGGTGLGLSLVRKLARLMGGEAGVESTLGEGARFWFRLPTRPASAPSVQAVALETAAAGAMADAGRGGGAEGGTGAGRETGREAGGSPRPVLRGKVLVAEDDAIHRNLMVLALKRCGLEVAVVEDGQAAVDAVAAGAHFDLILMDVAMPVLEGDEAARRILAQPAGRDVPIIAVTAGAFEHDRRRCQAAGMVGFIAKPLQLPELERLLEHWLGEKTVPPAVDHEKMHELMQELVPLLVQHKFDAFARLADLRAEVGTGPGAEVLEDIATMLNTLNFDQALIRLREFAETLGRPLP